ncbi:DUF2177 family protein [bacterium]|nr:DUF2177 family protein [bacterium]
MVATIIFVLIDAVWLSVVAKNFYKNNIGHLMAKKPNFLPAVIFYALYILGLVFFVITPAIEKDSVNYAIGAGAFLGLLMYATYDLTNNATLKAWPAKVTIIDMIWGATITSVVSSITFLIFR